MATTFDYPNNLKLSVILQAKLPKRISDMNDPLLALVPMESVEEADVAWEQKDNYKGLTQLRGYNGSPTRISKVGSSRYLMEPGIYGEYDVLDELRMTRGRQLGTFGDVIDISKLIMESQDQLIDRFVNRHLYITSQLLVNGSFLVTSPDGGVIHRDSYAIRKFTATVAWSTLGSSTPLQDLRSLPLLARGYSVRFDRTSQIFMNRTTFNAMVNNTNAADLGGLFKMVSAQMGGVGTLNEANVAKLFDNENLPQIVIYEEGYYDESNTFQLFIPDGKAILIGKRTTAEPVAKMLMTRNVNVEGGGGVLANMYMRVIDHGDKIIPRQIETHLGFNGGPAVYFPSAIISMSLF